MGQFKLYYKQYLRTVWDRKNMQSSLAFIYTRKGFPGASDSKESASNVGDLGLIPGWGRSPGGEHGHPLQDSCLENPVDRGAWWATVHGVAKSQTKLNNHKKQLVSKRDNKRKDPFDHRTRS